MNTAADSRIPLCVDLDGTLIRTDMLWESCFFYLRRNPLGVIHLFVWLAKGKAHLKQMLAHEAQLDVRLIPLNETFVEWLQTEKANGRRLILCTAADILLAQQMSDRVGLFEEVIASDGKQNLKGRNKAKALHERFGANFDYAGNAHSDWEIWKVCRNIVAVQTPASMTGKLKASGRLELLSQTGKPFPSVLRRTMRVHQWVKNVLIFAPLVAAHKAFDLDRLIPTLFCFAAFSMAASATYVVNDLLDLSADRMHKKKRTRPMAAGDLSIQSGIMLSALLMVAAVVLGLLSKSLAVCALVIFYASSSVVYSAFFKKRALLDVFALSGFYTLRIIIGGFAGDVPLSGWFLSFSVFLFLSLGFAKRATELHSMQTTGIAPAGRGYQVSDFQPVVSFGIASAFSAALVLSLYMQSAEVRALYVKPEMLWGLFPILLYWLMRIWVLASRGTLHEDPITFAIKDKLTWLAIAVSVMIMKLAATPLWR